MFCGLLGGINFAQGACAGGVLGAFTTISEGMQRGILRDPDFGRVLRTGMMKSAGNFGGWLAIFSSSKCSAAAIRGKKDTANSFIGGFVAGSTVAMFQRAGPRVAIGAGIGNALLITALESFNFFGGSL